MCGAAPRARVSSSGSRCIVLGTILIACWHKSSQLRAGGAAVARSLGGVHGQRRRQRSQAPAPREHRRRNGHRGAHPQAAGVRAARRGGHQRLRGGPFARRSGGGGHAGRARHARPRSAAGRHRPRVQSHPQRRHEDQHAADRVDLRPVRHHRSRARASCAGAAAARATRGVKIIAFGIFVAGSVGHVRRPAVAGRGLAPPRAPRRCLGGAVHAQSAGAAGRVHRDGGERSRHAARARGVRRRGAHVLRGQRSGAGPASSAARGSPRIRRSKSACARSMRASRRSSSARWSATRSANGREARASRTAAAAMPAAAAAATPPPKRAARRTRAGCRDCRRMRSPVCAGDRRRPPPPRDRAATPPTASAGRIAASMTSRRLTLAARVALAETLPSGVRMVAGRALPPDVLRNRLSARSAGRDRRARRAGRELQRSPCRPRSSPRCWPRSRRSGARSSRGSRRCSASNYSRKRRRRSRASPQLAPAARLPLLTDLLALLDALEPADRKRLRARRARVRARPSRPATCCVSR